MRLSIILATKNRPTRLPIAVASVLGQTDPRWELVVYDNGEPVQSVLPPDERIRYVHGTASGPADAYAKALALATGDVVMPLADDDTLYPSAVATVLEGIGEAEWGYARTDFCRDGYIQFVLGDVWDPVRMRTHYYLGGAVFWRRSFSDRIGTFREEWDGVADYDLYLRFGDAAQPVYLPVSLYRYNDWEGTDTNIRAGNAAEKSALLHARPLP